MTERARLDFSDRNQRLACSALVVLLSILLLAAGAFEPLEHRLAAARASLLDRPPTGDVVIVEIDARSLSELRSWPWSRHYHAQTVRQLHRARANIIAFDVDFSASSDAAGDEAFAQALSDAEPVILPIFEQRASSRTSESATIRSRPASPFKAAWVGGVNIFPGSDGVVRDYPAALMIGGHIQPSIAVLLSENSSMGDRSFEPDWSIDAGRIPRYSYVDVMKGRVPGSAIAGKRVLVGATAIELGDRYTVPKYGMVPGVVVQALAAESLLQGRAISRSGLLPTLAGIIAIALLLGGLPHRRFHRSYIPCAIAILAIIGALPTLVQANWPISVDTAPWLFAGLACIALRTGLEVRTRVRSGKLADAETGLPNRLALEAALTAFDPQTPTLAAAAIERFEGIRDALGTTALAEAVRECASRLGRLAGGPVYRLAPDVLAWSVLQGADAGANASSIADSFRESVATSDGPVDISLTIGLDGEPGIGASLRIERAMAAINSARTGNTVWQWYEGVDQGLRRQLSMMGDLRQGMASGEVRIAYQPKLHLGSRQIESAEVLVRWEHPTEGSIPPDQFITLAESTGVIHELTEFVLRAAISDSARWRRMGVEICVAVNVSAMDISQPGFAVKVRKLLGEFGVEPRNLGLEITESAIIRSKSAAIAALAELRELGVRLSIDDYGTGQSTLSYLKKLPVHELKIDQSFVKSLCASSADQILVRSTIDLAHDLGLQVVAEGIEDEATLGLLARLGCDMAQGYYISRPISFDELSALLTPSNSKLQKSA